MEWGTHPAIKLWDMFFQIRTYNNFKYPTSDILNIRRNYLLQDASATLIDVPRIKSQNMHSVWTAWFQFWNKQHHLRIDVLFFCCIFNEQRIQWVQLDRQKKASKYNDTYLHHRISRAPLMRQPDRHLKLKQNWQPYSERTTRRILKQMGYSSRRQHRVLFLSAKNRRRRLQFT